MSQIGYMIMGVASFAYVAGMFHLMTHAFFKALLFMAAGSVISAMAGEQNLDKMGGFKRAMPFTFACMAIGGLSLAGVPPFAGFFSKDEILAQLITRGGWFVVLAVLGYVGAFMTAIYTWRMIFRAFYGPPVEQARELEEGHLYHAPEPTNPATGEVEDIGVGFPGPDHQIAEREWTMKIAMGVLALGAIFAGLLQVGHLTSVIHNFLEPTFHDSPYYDELEPSDGATWGGWVAGTVLSLGGIFLAWQLWVVDRERAGVIALRARLAGLYTLFSHKWYFDEIIDAVIVRPFAMFGRFSRNVFERVVINGIIVGGPAGAVRAGSAAVRAIQSGFLRYYAALLLVGVDRARPLLPHLGLDDDPPLDPALLPARAGDARRAGAAHARAVRAARRRARLAVLRRADAVRLRHGVGPAAVPDRRQVDPVARRSATRSASTG